MLRIIPVLALFLGLAACGGFKDLEEKPEPMGRFLLGHNIVVVDNPQIGPLSRKATDEEWETFLTAAIDERFGRYDGDLYFHIGIKLDAYMLAPVGVPGAFTPDSLLVMTVTIWDDANQRKLNEEPKTFRVTEPTTPGTFISSGLTQSREEQLLVLSRAAAKKLHNWMLEHPEWFGDASLMDPETTSDGTAAELLTLEDLVDDVEATPATEPTEEVIETEEGTIVIEEATGA